MKCFTAQGLLGRNFISPETLTKFGVTYGEKDIRSLYEKFPDTLALRWCKENNGLLLPGPPNVMSVMDMTRYAVVNGGLPRLYVDRSTGLERRSGMKEWGFLTADLCQPGWLVIGRNPTCDSLNKLLEEQKRLALPDGCYIPNVAELTWATALCGAILKVRLILGSYHLRTSSVSKGKNFWGQELLSPVVISYWSHGYEICIDDGAANQYVGLALARKI